MAMEVMPKVTWRHSTARHIPEQRCATVAARNSANLQSTGSQPLLHGGGGVVCGDRTRHVSTHSQSPSSRLCKMAGRGEDVVVDSEEDELVSPAEILSRVQHSPRLRDIVNTGAFLHRKRCSSCKRESFSHRYIRDNHLYRGVCFEAAWTINIILYARYACLCQGSTQATASSMPGLQGGAGYRSSDSFFDPRKHQYRNIDPYNGDESHSGR
jgi:hypothetical protein